MIAFFFGMIVGIPIGVLLIALMIIAKEFDT